MGECVGIARSGNKGVSGLGSAPRPPGFGRDPVAGGTRSTIDPLGASCQVLSSLARPPRRAAWAAVATGGPLGGVQPEAVGKTADSGKPWRTTSTSLYGRVVAALMAHRSASAS